MADFGRQTDVGGTRYTVGVQVVPDVLPASDGTTASIYPGSFGQVFGPSISGHKWWISLFNRYDTIMTGGAFAEINGGSSAPNRPLQVIKINGYWTTGIDFSVGDYSNACMKFASGQTSGSATAGGGQAALATVNGYIVVDVGGVAKKIPYFNT